MGGVVSLPVSTRCTCWREIDWSLRKELLARTREYDTGTQLIPNVNILLVGNVGSGKSSICNTVDSIFKGRISTQAESKTSESSTSVTKKFRFYKPGGRRGNPVAFNFCDTMGMELEQGLVVEDMVYVLDGNIPNGFTFHPHKRIIPDDRGFVLDPKLSDRIHCVGVVIDGAKLSSISAMEKSNFERIASLANARKIALVFLITHIDEVCELVRKNAKYTHTSGAVLSVVDEVCRVTGTTVDHVFPVQNYCEELELSVKIDMLSLTALNEMLRLADEYFKSRLKLIR